MKKYIFSIACFISITSCKKFLDKEPTDFVSPDVYYSTAAQLQTALNSVYDGLGQNNIYAMNYTQALTWSTDEGLLKQQNVPQLTTYQYTSSDPYVLGLWTTSYACIERANRLLANINKPSMDAEARNKIKGEAIFLRAYYYFLLVTNFGDVPLITTPTTSVLETAVARTPVKDVYAQIIKDMTEAEGLLENQKVTALGYSGKVTKTAVEGILARVCLHAAGYPNRDQTKYADALSWALKVVNSGEHALAADYTQIFKNIASDKYDVKESIWEVEFAVTSTGGAVDAGSIGNYFGPLTTNTITGNCYSLVNTTGKLYNSYALDATNTNTPLKNSFDIRRDWNCANYSLDANGNRVYSTSNDTYSFAQGKFRREYETTVPRQKNQSQQNWPLLRYSDVLLMVAEADNEVNNGATSVGKDALNAVRKRGYGILYGNVLKSITITNQGTGYTTAPTVAISGGGGSGATATAIIAGGKVTGINITSRGALAPGSYFTAAPTVTFTGGGGTGAVATATISSSTDADYTGATDHNIFLQVVVDERARELCYEAFRKLDLIRWGTFITTMKALIPLANLSAVGKFYHAAQDNVDVKHNLQPIPILEMNLNPLLTQNPGW